MDAPPGLKGRGKKLWDEITTTYTLDIHQQVVLGEACRALNRLDRLDREIRNKEPFGYVRYVRDADIIHDEKEINVTLTMDAPMAAARQEANVFKQLMAALRLPDGVTGKQPQKRGGDRGVMVASGKGAGATVVSALEMAQRRAAS